MRQMVVQCFHTFRGYCPFFSGYCEMPSNGNQHVRVIKVFESLQIKTYATSARAC